MFTRSALVLFTVAALPALADYNSGVGAYARKDYPAARAAFLEVAKFADAGAQRALASMYARGEGGDVDLLEGYAWASLAAEQGDATAGKIRDAIAASLPAPVKPLAEAKLKEYHGLYGIAAVSQQLHPQSSGNEPAVFHLQKPGARLRLQQPVEYPERAKENNDQGWACIGFYVGSNGQPLDLRGYDNKGNGILVSGAVRSLQNWRFEPEAGERRVGYCLDFLIEDGRTWRSDAQLQQLKDKARKGDARSLTELAKLLADSQRASTGRVETQVVTDAWLQAALSGSAEAQFELASRLLRGDGCVADRDKAIRWLRHALAQNHPPAQHYAALYLAGEKASATEKALAISPAQREQWLRAAAEAGNPDAKLQLAKTFLRPGPERDATTALALLLQLDADFHIHVLDWRAYAHTLLGDLDDALDDAEEALELAGEIGLATEARQAAVTALSNGQPANLPAH